MVIVKGHIPLLQEEFDEAIGTPQLEERFTFQFPDYTFADPNIYQLSYSIMSIIRDGEIVENLPDWLSFDGSTRKFEGIPPLEEKSVKYRIRIQAQDSDRGFSEKQTLVINLNNPVEINPEVPSLQEQFDQQNPYVKYGNIFKLEIVENTFIDLDGDSLIYEI